LDKSLADEILNTFQGDPGSIGTDQRQMCVLTAPILPDVVRFVILNLGRGQAGQIAARQFDRQSPRVIILGYSLS
jgi:hypothetical protein